MSGQERIGIREWRGLEDLSLQLTKEQCSIYGLDGDRQSASLVFMVQAILEFQAFETESFQEKDRVEPEIFEPSGQTE